MMDERERREFNAGLSEEVDAWLRGDTSRRQFLTRLMLMGGAAMLPGLGYTASGSKAWAAAADISKVELADKGTPLGAAQAAAVKASTEGPTDGSAYRAVQAAQAYKDKGVTPQSHLRGGSAGARAQELFRTAVAGSDRHQFQRRRAAASRSVFEADRRAHRQFRRLRRSRHRAGVDSRAGQRRGRSCRSTTMSPST